MKIKQRIVTCAAAVLCAAVVAAQSVPLYASAASAGTAVTTDYLNLRQGAGTNTKVLLTLGRGVSVTILDGGDAQWAKVRTQSGKQGYCSKQYLSFSDQSGKSGFQTSSGTTASSGTAVTTANLNMRSSASLSGSILQVVPKGTSMTLLDGSNAQWAKVRTQNGREGWCSRGFLTLSGVPSGGNSSAGTAVSGTALTTDYLNLRKGAGTSYAVILTIGKSVTVTLLDNSNGQWAKVRTPNGKEGWCSKQYLKISAAPGGSGTGTSSGAASSGSSSSASSSPESSSPSSASGGSSGTGDTSSGTQTGTPDTGSSDSRVITGASVTADVLRLREQPGTAGKILDNLPNGTLLTVLDVSVSGWVKVQTPGGKTGYVSADYVTLRYEGDTPAQSGSNSSAVSLSSVAQTVPQGKTLYLKAATSPAGGAVTWSSSNPAVATVTNGYVLALAKGSTVITASSGSGEATCAVTVSEAEAIRTAYASPNIAGVGETVTLTAVTDPSRDGVRFTVTLPDGSTRTVAAQEDGSETVSGTTTKKWTGTTTFAKAGKYSFTAFSSKGGPYSSSGYTTDLLISSQSDFTVSTGEERRVSDGMLALMAKWEGSSSCVYTDQLSSNQVATIGYGCTLGPNAQFYNGLSNTEMWSLLVNTVNRGSYTTELNKMIRNNHFLMNQNQADCLIDFAYNVGAGYFNSSNEMDFIKILKNAVVPPQIPSGGIEATVTLEAPLRANTGNLSDQTGTVPAGASVVVKDASFGNTRDGWYRVELSDGTEGWINSGYVHLSTSDSLVHDLNYTNAYAFGSELIRWNLAGGKFYTGLFYRRLGEANVFNYNDYAAVRYNQYGYQYPSTASSLE